MTETNYYCEKEGIYPEKRKRGRKKGVIIMRREKRHL